MQKLPLYWRMQDFSITCRFQRGQEINLFFFRCENAEKLLCESLFTTEPIVQQ